jgi:hypothetical protein
MRIAYNSPDFSRSFESITANPQDQETLVALLGAGLIDQDISLTESAAQEIRVYVTPLGKGPKDPGDNKRALSTSMEALF